MNNRAKDVLCWIARHRRATLAVLAPRPTSENSSRSSPSDRSKFHHSNKVNRFFVAVRHLAAKLTGNCQSRKLRKTDPLRNLWSIPARLHQKQLHGAWNLRKRRRRSELSSAIYLNINTASAALGPVCSYRTWPGAHMDISTFSRGLVRTGIIERQSAMHSGSNRPRRGARSSRWRRSWKARRAKLNPLPLPQGFPAVSCQR